MKPLKPSWKENKRYLLLKGNNLKKEVESAILDYIGILGMAKASPNWIKNDNDSGILCINREALNNVIASFTIWPKEIIVKRVSGTLKGLKK